MTVIEGALGVALLAPVAGVFGSWLGGNRRSELSAWSLLIAGVAGLVAGGLGAVQSAPLAVVTPIFFDMTITFDKFATLFFLSLSLVAVTAGLFMWLNTRFSPGIFVLAIGAQWAIVAGNTFGFLAGWSLFIFGGLITAVLWQKNNSEQRGILQWLLGTQTSWLAIMIGLFLLSAGALFSDFGTLSYIASEFGGGSLLVIFGLLTVGFVAPMLPWWRATSKNLLLAESGLEASVIQALAMIISLYGFGRLLLFILPPLPLTAAMALLAIAGISMLVSSWSASRAQVFSDRQHYLWLTWFSWLFFAMAVAMCLQFYAAYDAMNTALFAALFTAMFVPMLLVGYSQLVNLQINYTKTKHTIFLAGAMIFGVAGVLPLASFVPWWMLGNTLLGMDIKPMSGVITTVAIICLVLTFVWLMQAGVNGMLEFLRFKTPNSDSGSVVIGKLELLGFWWTGVVAVGAGLTAPRLFLTIGAEPLTLGVGSWSEAIVATNGLLPLLAIVGCLAVAGLLAVGLQRLWGDQQPNAAIAIDEQIYEPTGNWLLPLNTLVMTKYNQLATKILVPVWRKINVAKSLINMNQDKWLVVNIAAMIVALIAVVIFAV